MLSDFLKGTNMERSVFEFANSSSEKAKPLQEILRSMANGDKPSEQQLLLLKRQISKIGREPLAICVRLDREVPVQLSLSFAATVHRELYGLQWSDLKVLPLSPKSISEGEAWRDFFSMLRGIGNGKERMPAVCPNCGRVFQPKFKAPRTARFCSVKCKNRSNYLKGERPHGKSAL